MTTTTPVARPAEPAERCDSWRPLSRIVLRKPKGNRRMGSARRLPAPKQAVDACGRALRRMAPALVGLAVVSAFSGAAAASYQWVTTSPRFAITAIELRGNHTVTSEALTELLQVHPGDNMFATATSAMEQTLERHPWIASAKVHRELPHRLVITVQERTAAALVDLGGLYLVEPSGLPFKRAALDTGEGDGLPVISGIERLAFRADPQATTQLIRAGLEALAHWRAEPARPAVAQLAFDSYRGLTLQLAEPSISLHLGALDDPALPERMALFQAAWSHLDAAERAQTQTLYLDAGPGQVTVAFAKN
ncbi:MAG: FtsQ-type POTRA domain-containing protein [Myxococcales bacterium]|nr:FtsQ-type POTRA domain-containing protein [Myxococcales bacterium]HRC57211.1 FtsQ-type POTRA domain-containing protein [Kofleriaceae bacterium]